MLLDCRIARRRETGGARYARELATRLRDRPDGPDVRVLMGPPPLPRRNQATSLGNLALDLAWTHIALPLLALRHRASAIHSTFNWGPAWAPCPRIVTIHDLTWERIPDAYPGGFRRFAQIFTRLSARRSERVIAVSQATADDIHDLYGVPADRIDVIYTGIDGLGDAPTAGGERRRVVLHVGEFEPRKRVPALVEGFTRFAASPAGAGWRLVLVGRGGADEEAVAARVAGEPACEMRGFVADDALARLYSTAGLLVSASRAEGFCLPIAEALRMGLPVMVADSPALVEAGGPGAIVMPEPLDAAGISRALGAAVADSAALATRGRQGPAHAARFSWERCVADTIAVYDRIARRRGVAT